MYMLQSIRRILRRFLSSCVINTTAEPKSRRKRKEGAERVFVVDSIMKA